MRSERGLSTILHCLQWYKLVLRTPRLSTAAVQYLVRVIKLSIDPTQRTQRAQRNATQCKALAYLFGASDANDARKALHPVRNERTDGS